MSGLNTVALAACHRPDIPKMNQALAHMGFSKYRVVVVANGRESPTQEEIPNAIVIEYPTYEYCMPNWWNWGLSFISDGLAIGNHEIFIFNADTFAHGSDVLQLSQALRDHDLAATGPDQSDRVQGSIHKETRAEPFDLGYRLPGYAFVLKGELGLRADPRFRHWYIDDDLEWQARLAGGTGLVPGVKVQHPANGNPLSPMLQQFAAEDREKFKIKWGVYPH